MVDDKTLNTTGNGGEDGDRGCETSSSEKMARSQMGATKFSSDTNQKFEPQT